MVQFLSIIFFLGFLQFLLGFSKVPVFLCHPVLMWGSNLPISADRTVVYCVWNVMTHARKSDFVFQRNGRVHINRHGRQFSRLLAVEVCASAVVMLDTPSSEVVWRVLATHSIRQFPLHFPSSASPCAIIIQLDSTTNVACYWCQHEAHGSVAELISTSRLVTEIPFKRKPRHSDY